MALWFPLLSLTWAAWPIPVQGTLTDASGAPLAGVHDVTLRVYDQDADTTPDHATTLPVTFDAGRFSLTIDGVDPALLDAPQLALTVAVDGGAESDRAPVGWAARAVHAAFAAEAADLSCVGCVNGDALASNGVAAGTYTLSTITVDADGRVTSAVSGAAPQTGVILASNSGLSGAGTAGSPLGLDATAVNPGTYTFATLTVDANGRLTAASNGASPLLNVALAPSGGLSGAGTSGSPLGLANTAVNPGTYTAATITVDAAGRITGASNGAAGPAIVTATDTSMTNGELLTVTHAADANNTRLPTVVASTIDAVFYADFESSGADRVSDAVPTFLDGNTSVSSARAKSGSRSLFSLDHLSYAQWNLSAGTLSFGTGDFTVQFWFQTDQGFISGGYSGMILANFQGSHSGTTVGHWGIGMSSLEGIRWNQDGTGTSLLATTGFGKYAADTWYHIAVERSAGTLRTYVNGTPRETFSLPGTIGSSSQNTLFLGGLQDWDNVPGLFIDDVQIHRRALYAGASFTPPTGVVGGANGPVFDATRYVIRYDGPTQTSVQKVGGATEPVTLVVRTF